MASEFMVRARKCGTEWVNMAMPVTDDPVRDAHLFAQGVVNPDNGGMCEAEVLQWSYVNQLWYAVFTYTAKTRASANKGA